jgi:hypothetical protein
MKNAVSHIAAFLMSVIMPMISSGCLKNARRRPSLGAILAEWLLQCKASRAEMMNDFRAGSET